MLFAEDDAPICFNKRHNPFDIIFNEMTNNLNFRHCYFIQFGFGWNGMIFNNNDMDGNNNYNIKQYYQLLDIEKYSHPVDHIKNHITQYLKDNYNQIMDKNCANYTENNDHTIFNHIGTVSTIQHGKRPQIDDHCDAQNYSLKHRLYGT